MKKYALLLLVLFCLTPALKAQGMVFGVEIEPELKSTYYFGYKAGSLVPYAGIEMLKIGGNYSMYQEDWNEDDSGDRYRAIENEYDIDVSAMMFIPRMGLKFYLSQSNISSYLKLGVFKSFASVSGEISISETDYDSLGNVTFQGDTTMPFDEETEEVIGEVLGVFGLNIGFGCEYHFSPNFSIGGEAGFNYWNTGGDYEDEEEDLGPPYDRDVWENKISANLGITYAKFSLNYYFGGKD